MSREEFVDICRKNRFRVDYKLEFYDFDIHSVPDIEPFKNGFVIISGWNPNNILRDKSENDQRNLMLFKDLLKTEYEFDEAYGYREDSVEESYCIYGMSLDEAIALGKKYHQCSIFYSGSDGLGYFDATKKEPILAFEAA